MADFLGQFWHWLAQALPERLIPLLLASSYLVVKIILRHLAARLFPPVARIIEMLAWLGVDLLVLTSATSVAAHLGGRFAMQGKGAVIWYTVLVIDLFLVYCMYLLFRKSFGSGKLRLRCILYSWLCVLLGLPLYLSLFSLLVNP